MTICILLVAGQIFFALLNAHRKRRSKRALPLGGAVVR
jgi:hypothetical protein